MANSPTSRSLAECKRRGWPCAITERWNAWAKIRQDLFGFIDVLALDTWRGLRTEEIALNDGRILGIQACAGASHAAREAKIEASPNIRPWIEAGGRCEVWSWSKRGARGKVKRWTLRISRAQLTDTGVRFVEITPGEGDAVQK